jgi:hypothetical protein
MKLAKTIGRVGFAFGFLGSLLFYLSPYPLLYESHIVCPACPYAEIPFATAMTWVQVALSFGLFCGLIYALIGFAIGYGISQLRLWHPRGRTAEFEQRKRSLSNNQLPSQPGSERKGLFATDDAGLHVIGSSARRQCVSGDATVSSIVL